MAKDAEVQVPGPVRSVAVGAVARKGGAPARWRVGRSQVDGADGPDRRSDAAIAEASVAQARAQLEAERARTAQAGQAMTEACRQLRQLRADLLAEAEGQLLDLAMEIARKVLMQEIQAGRYEIEPIVAEAMRHVPARHEVVVHLHPDDYAQCKLIEQLAGDSQNVRFLADPNVAKAGCLLETPEGAVDSAIETHLATISESLKKPE
jgi:flagellar assembly protein FliH